MTDEVEKVELLKITKITLKTHSRFIFRLSGPITVIRARTSQGVKQSINVNFIVRAIASGSHSTS